MAPIILPNYRQHSNIGLQNRIKVLEEHLGVFLPALRQAYHDMACIRKIVGGKLVVTRRKLKEIEKITENYLKPEETENAASNQQAPA